MQTTQIARRSTPMPMCPLRPGEPCSLCFPGATGPKDCGLVYLAMDDPELREELRLNRLAIEAMQRRH